MAAASVPAVVVVHIPLAPELQGRRVAAEGDGAIGEAGGQFRPGAAAGLVERLVARFVGEQIGMGADERRERGELVLGPGMGVEMHHGLRVAMQVEDEIGLAGLGPAGSSSGLRRIGRLPGIELGAQGLPDQADICRPVARQLALDALGSLRARDGDSRG